MNGTKRRLKREGFTLIEIMIIVAFIGLLAVLAIPGFMKARKLSQGKRIVNDARIIDTAVEAWAMEQNKTDGAAVDVSALSSYVRIGVVPNPDVLGNPYAIGPVGTNQVLVSPTSKTALVGVGIDWGAY